MVRALWKALTIKSFLVKTPSTLKKVISNNLKYALNFTILNFWFLAKNVTA